MAYRVQTTTLTGTGNSSGIMLDPVSKQSILQLTAATTTSSLDVVIQFTLDDPITSTGQTWASLSTTHYSSVSILPDDGVCLIIDSPLVGLRIHSSTNVSTNVLTLKSFQSVTA